MCNDSATPGVAIGPEGLSINGSCINWNQYYTNCRAGEKNPFQGAISFDNIGLAWVAIFLVSSPISLLHQIIITLKSNTVLSIQTQFIIIH